MDNIFNNKNLTIQSKFRWFPSLNTKFQLVDDEGTLMGEIILNPAWSAPFLWLIGFLFEILLIFGGAYLIIRNPKENLIYGAVSVLVGLFLFLGIALHSFLSSRASSTVKIIDKDKKTLLKAVKGWALWRPTFTIRNAETNDVIGTARQAFFFGDRRYILRDKEGKKWGTIRRKLWRLKYRVKKNGRQVAEFRTKLIDARKLITGINSYILEYQDENLTTDERALILGAMTYVDVLSRQKKLSPDKQETKEDTTTEN